MLYHFIEEIDEHEAISYYNSLYTEFSAPRMKEIPSLEEFLKLTLKKTDAPPSTFEKDTDDFLTAYALKKLNEHKKAAGNV